MKLKLPDFAMENLRNLKKIRNENKLSLRQLASESEVSLSTLQEYERGCIERARLKSYNKLAYFFGWRILSHRDLVLHSCFTDELDHLWYAPPEPLPVPKVFTFTPGRTYEYKIKGKGSSQKVIETFIYTGKRGKHHIFKEVKVGYEQHFTDAQLIGKNIKEVANEKIY